MRVLYPTYDVDQSNCACQGSILDIALWLQQYHDIAACGTADYYRCLAQWSASDTSHDGGIQTSSTSAVWNNALMRYIRVYTALASMGVLTITYFIKACICMLLK